MSTPLQLRVPRRILDEMVAQARREAPNECCGLLAGPPLPEVASTSRPARSAHVRQVSRCFPLVNEAASPTAFLSEPASMFAAVREMNRLGLEIIGVYHSHPAAEPVPSEKDRRENFSPDVAMIIISLKHEPPLIRGWRVSAERTEAEIIIEEV